MKLVAEVGTAGGDKYLTPGQENAAGDGNQLETLMSTLINVRAAARKNKDFAIGDLIRKRLAELGITLEDRPTGTEWRRG
jgi:cysteinyl-tRNA synthetase